MDFIYEEIATDTADAVKVTKHDDKTDEAFHKFEDHVDEQLQKTSKAILGFVKEKDSLNFQIPENLGGTVTNKAQEMLGKLDDNLEKVEELTQGYWNTVSKKSFWSSMANTISTQFQEVLDFDAKEAEGSNKDTAFSSITDTKLKQLAIDKSLYLKYDAASLPKDFVIKEHSEEIQELLNKDLDLKSLHEDVVPAALDDATFWNIYFTKKAEILNLASKKRDLLSAKEDLGKEQAIGWDDEEEDSEEEIIPSKTAKAKQDSNTSKETTSSAKTESKVIKQEENDDEEDDDWE